MIAPIVDRGLKMCGFHVLERFSGCKWQLGWQNLKPKGMALIFELIQSKISPSFDFSRLSLAYGGCEGRLAPPNSEIEAIMTLCVHVKSVLPKF